MVPNNRILRFLPGPSAANRPAGKARLRLRDDFAVGHELRDDDDVPDFFVNQRPERTEPSYDRPPTVEEIRFHAALFERMAMLRQQTRRGLWSRVWGFLCGD